MATIIDKLNHIKQTKSMLKSAINQKGGGLKETDSFRSYVSEVENLGDKTLDEFAWVDGYKEALIKSISHDWPDIMDIMYSHQGVDDPYYAFIFLFDDRDDSTLLDPSGTKEVITSDGIVYTENLDENITHEWNKLQDINGKYRWVIMKYSEARTGPLYSSVDAISFAMTKDYLENIPSGGGYFSGLNSLLLIPEMEGDLPNMYNIFSYSSSLKIIPDFLKEVVNHVSTAFPEGLVILEDLDNDNLGTNNFENVVYLKNIRNERSPTVYGKNFHSARYIENYISEVALESAAFGAFTALECINGLDIKNTNFLSGIFNNDCILSSLKNINMPLQTGSFYLGKLSNLKTFENLNAPLLESFEGAFKDYYSMHSLTNVIARNDVVFDDDSFRGCGKLINLSFNIDDPIRFTGLNLADSPLLSKKSVVDLFNQLDELWGENAGEVITLNTMTYFRLSEEELAIATDKGWVIKYEDSIPEDEE